MRFKPLFFVLFFSVSLLSPLAHAQKLEKFLDKYCEFCTPERLRSFEYLKKMICDEHCEPKNRTGGEIPWPERPNSEGMVFFRKQPTSPYDVSPYDVSPYDVEMFRLLNETYRLRMENSRLQLEEARKNGFITFPEYHLELKHYHDGILLYKKSMRLYKQYYYPRSGLELER